jgi:hypothetical protein
MVTQSPRMMMRAGVMEKRLQTTKAGAKRKKK